MAYREVYGVEIREVIRRWQAGLSQRCIASGTGVSRPTVRRYIDAAEAAGIQPGGSEPSEEQLAALATLSLAGPRQAEAPSEEQLAPWAEQIQGWLQADRLQLTRIQELLAERGCDVSYSSLRRFIRRHGWGRLRLTAQQSIDLYELVIGRHRSSSFVITSNRAVEEWLGLFDDPILGNSALDRLANASYQIVIEGESYRQRLSPHRALLEAQTGGD